MGFAAALPAMRSLPSILLGGVQGRERHRTLTRASPDAMAAPTAFLALLMASLCTQNMVAGMRQQAGAELGGGGNSGGGTARPSAYPALRFRADQTFKILQLTDLHYGEDKRLDERSDKASGAAQGSGAGGETVLSLAKCHMPSMPALHPCSSSAT